MPTPRPPLRLTSSPRPPNSASPRSRFRRTSTALPRTAPASPARWSPKHWPMAIWGSRCRFWPPAEWRRRSPTSAVPISRAPTSPSSPGTTSRRPVWRSPNRTRCSTRPCSRPPPCARRAATGSMASSRWCPPPDRANCSSWQHNSTAGRRCSSSRHPARA